MPTRAPYCGGIDFLRQDQNVVAVGAVWSLISHTDLNEIKRPGRNISMGEKIVFFDVAVIAALYLFGFSAAVKYAREVGESWVALNLPVLGIMGAGEGLWLFIRKRFL